MFRVAKVGIFLPKIGKKWTPILTFYISLQPTYFCYLKFFFWKSWNFFFHTVHRFWTQKRCTVCKKTSKLTRPEPDWLGFFWKSWNFFHTVHRFLAQKRCTVCKKISLFDFCYREDFPGSPSSKELKNKNAIPRFHTPWQTAF